MTNCKSWLLALFLVVFTGFAGAQSLPKELSWAWAEFDGTGEWCTRLPQLLVRNWETISEHQLTDGERLALKQRFLRDTLISLEIQTARLQLDLDKKRLVSPLSPSELANSQKSLLELETKIQQARAGESSTEPPFRLPLRVLWAAGREGLPWAAQDRRDFLTRSQALYVITGSVRSIAGYLVVTCELFSQLENRVLVEWEGRFSADEAADRMAEASDQFREALLGRPWAALVLTSPHGGTRARLQGQWHSLPWLSDDLVPGTYDLEIQTPGRPDQRQSLSLEKGLRKVLSLDTVPSSAPKLVLETEPPGASLYADSQYLGPSPQTIDRPLATVRIRAQSPGWETLAWEVGPSTISPSRRALSSPRAPLSVQASKDEFYTLMAAVALGLGVSAFTAAATQEQLKLVNYYALSGNLRTYDRAVERWGWYSASNVASVVLTSGLFVWMMVELGDYLDTAQASLP